jgi:alanyl-tRNA synthetase
VAEQIRILDGASRLIGPTPAELEQKIAALQDELAAERRRFEQAQREAGRKQAGSLSEQAEQVNGARLIVAEVQAASVDVLRQMGDELRKPAGAALVILGANIGGRPQFAVMTKELPKAHAGKLIGEIAQVAGGKGGGRPDSAQGGGTNPAKLADALEHGRRLARETLSGNG